MRVMIWVDMEGIAGIEAWDQVMGGAPLYEEGRRLLTGETNAAVRGAKRAGADEIIVVDCHGAGGAFSFRSMIPDQLEPGAEYVRGYPWARYVAPLEQGCHAAILVGAHARAGTAKGVLCHTVSSEAWYNATINDVLVGESGILAALCGTWNTPIVFVAGDEATCREVRELCGAAVVGVQTKIGLGRYSARNLAPRDACERIEAGVFQALNEKRWPAPYKPGSPVTFKVELAVPDHVDHFRGLTSVQILGPRTVASTGDTFYAAWDQFWYRR
ncbi:MAG: M55 family metallopeptidase [Chloroflexota bacterium]